MKKQIYLSFFSAFVAFVLASFFAACGNVPVATTAASANIATTVQSTTPTKNTAASLVPLRVISVHMAVNPSTVGNITCGTYIVETYTAIFHFPAHNRGGQVKFYYTTNNGRGTNPASLTVKPRQTSATYSFSWSGPLPADHTAPGPGGVMVTSPNAYTSQLLAPSGQCIPASFKVNSIGLSASPALTGHACGTSFTESYTATFHIAPDGPGGTIVFQYTTTNGRSGSPNVLLHVAAGQTTATYVFKWSGTLPADHTAPGVGIVMMSAPRQLISPTAVPQGACS